MIKDIRYNFKDFEIQEIDNSFCLVPVTTSYNFEQRTLLNSILNFGYVSFEPGIYTITARDIVEFWKYSKDTVLSKYDLQDYYSLLNLDLIYKERIPSIKTEGSFHGNDFKMTVVWVNNNSKMYSAPIAYEQKGLKLKELEYKDTIGSLYPEYFELYYLLDKANSNWKSWNTKERYEFLEEIELHSKKREIIIPSNLMELLNKHKNED